MAALTPATPAAPVSDADARAVRRRSNREWLALAAVLLAAGALLGFSHDRRLARAEAQEAARLSASARMLALNLAHQLQLAHLSLSGLRDEFAAGCAAAGFCQRAASYLAPRLAG